MELESYFLFQKLVDVLGQPTKGPPEGWGGISLKWGQTYWVYWCGPCTIIAFNTERGVFYKYKNPYLGYVEEFKLDKVNDKVIDEMVRNFSIL